MAISLFGCNEVVSSVESFENAKVTEFHKVSKRQRISFVTESNKVYNDFYISKRCSGCMINKGETITIRTVTRTWSDGSKDSYVDSYYIKEQLQ